MNQNESLEKPSKWKRSLKMLMAGVAVALAFAPKESAAKDHPSEAGDPHKQEVKLTSSKIQPVRYESSTGKVRVNLGEDYTIKTFNKDGMVKESRDFKKGVVDLFVGDGLNYKVFDAKGNQVDKFSYTNQSLKELQEKNQGKTDEEIIALQNQNDVEQQKAGEEQRLKDEVERIDATGGHEKEIQSADPASDGNHLHLKSQF